ncbi:uncharacterized protein Z519_05378 [Cladophialophora bantiana CBS 173.52]|uniref:Phosphoglycerate mutase n=1 Tax=Cladophialophora bantiana (strain ATCC 10958 / CBS 173.52 / CDC B-1940 / NIH 8579) TaxID=1442370 RepID=A0A0D2G654_CLAB1|nr:uncharacterized protein Z519_05378 [Cladophialophora bantiana CBS 173.52]KIW94062.1 hypothetical protein Z519_05378 [Cladophialophora bantiana CBS 173.52]
MGKQPAVVFVVRHGARLDQADRNWTATAEAPYDPPLSYGGWIQCQTLGLRINSELHNLNKQSKPQSEGKEDGVQEAQPRKRRKIIIHSSPYLRCVQSSIAIAAGIQHPQNHSRPHMKSRQLSSRSNLSPMDEALDTAADSSEVDRASLERVTSNDKEHTNRLGYNTCKLRIDAFLGEWQSAGYFQEGSAPPPSAVLVSQAKMSLQTPQEEIKGADLSSSLAFNLPPVDTEEAEIEITPVPVHEKTGLRAMAAVGHSLPKRPRNISFATELANGARILNRALQGPLGYSPPMPNYAIGSSDKIPPGFVAHARDACVEIDRDWDSQNEPLDWGDGGPFDEDWGKMHRRFRNGLQKMIAFYESQNDAGGNNRDEQDDDEELVVILVTHQAGCNALIRLLTAAPALRDVGLSSLSMAVRKEAQQAPSEPLSPTRRRGSLDLTISEDYDMKIIASTEHLRAPSNPLGLNSPRLGKSPAFASRRAVGADSPEGLSLGESVAPRGSASLMPARSISQRSHAADTVDDEPPTGLWRRGSRYSRDETTESSSDAFATPSSLSVGCSDSIQEEFTLWSGRGSGVNLKVMGSDEKSGSSPLLPVRSASQAGLWGGESSIKRERSPGKRRWTAVERSP